MIEMFKKKISVTLLNDKWEIIKPLIRVTEVPRYNELIYLDEDKCYYRVIQVVHNIIDKHGIFLILEKFEK